MEKDFARQMFYKCTRCKNVIESKKMEENYFVCPDCGNYEPLYCNKRVDFLVDKDSFQETNVELGFKDPLDFPEYVTKYENAVAKTKMMEGIITGKAKVSGEEIMLGVMDSRFIMASMGIAVGEKITRLFEDAMRDKLPVVLFAASGGARMQEGVFSLLQMAKTTSAVTEYQKSGGLFISYFTNPTLGGVTASFALLGDINLAEPGALIGFAGPRVIRQTIQQELPQGFQTAEFLLERGYIDEIVERKNMISYLLKIIKLNKRVSGK